MPHIAARDGIKLYYEEAGHGTPVVFVHEYAADYRTWEPQMRHFARSHRCVTYSQRGYPPSDVPTEPDKYLQDKFRDDVIAVMDALKIDKAHVVGHSMGAATSLHVGIKYPQRCISVTAAGCGYGSSPDPKKVEESRAISRENGKMFAETIVGNACAKELSDRIFFVRCAQRCGLRRKRTRGLQRRQSCEFIRGAHSSPFQVILGDAVPVTSQCCTFGSNSRRKSRSSG